MQPGRKCVPAICVLIFKFRFIEHFQIIIVGGGALDAPPPATVLRAVQGAGPYILKFKLLDKPGLGEIYKNNFVFCNLRKNFTSR